MIESMPSISDDDELAVLRRRAYAPGADISSDPAALRRLIELESRSSDDVAPAPSEVEEEPVDPAPSTSRPTHRGGGSGCRACAVPPRSC